LATFPEESRISIWKDPVKVAIGCDCKLRPRVSKAKLYSPVPAGNVIGSSPAFLLRQIEDNAAGPGLLLPFFRICLPSATKRTIAKANTTSAKISKVKAARRKKTPQKDDRQFSQRLDSSEIGQQIIGMFVSPSNSSTIFASRKDP